MPTLVGTRTARNLMTAFAGESQARNRYTYFASQARKDGFILVSTIFEETANQEMEHAKRLFKFMEGGECLVKDGEAFPFGIIADTVPNLRASAAGEHYEQSQMYPEFSAIAKEEGFGEISVVFANIAIAERFHEKRFNELAERIEKNLMFSRPQAVVWRCLKCGWTYEGVKPPEKCFACAHGREYFEVLNEGF